VNRSQNMSRARQAQYAQRVHALAPICIGKIERVVSALLNKCIKALKMEMYVVHKPLQDHVSAAIFVTD